MRAAALFTLALAGAGSSAAGLRIDPPAVAVSGPNRVQQLIVVEDDGGRVVADRTAAATFVSSNPAVATVSAAGLVTAVGPGEATVTATAGGKIAAVPVRAAAPAGGWTFRNHVVPTLTRTGCNSGACHGALAGKGGLKLSLRGYDPDSDLFALTRQASARRVDRSDPADSLLLKKAVRAMPHAGGTRFTDDSDHYALLREWITAGAAGPSDSDPALVRLDVFPKAALLKPKDTLRVVVRAVYSDGTLEDVTRWAKFSSSEEQVAAVNEDGVVTVAGHGEAAVAVNFGTRVATLTVTSPFPNPADAAAFAKSPRQNFIDDHVLAKLALLRLPPSAPCTDAEFVRRVYLDTCGILPKPEEVAAFLADRSPDRRAKLVDRLLDRTEYADYWAYKWSDLLLVSSRKLSQPAMWAFYRSVRQAVADNKPWDRFARDILTASGSTLTHGPANYFVLHKDVTELAESTAVTFLGMSVGCAKCHNHPLEKWTQDQYWAFTNLFSRVGLKTGDRANEVLVQPLPAGDAFHPRRGAAMPPAPLDAKPLAADDPADRRRYFADWLTAPENPYFAKAVVNRVWRSFLGRGLVEAEDDLRETNPPSNRELMDALVADFVKTGYDVKRLVRLIATSAAYQRSSKPTAANAADDRFYSRYLLRRLPAEVILDAYSDITGVPTVFGELSLGPTGGTRKSDMYPPGTRAMQLPDSMLISRFLEAFGRAERQQTCSCERTQDSSVTQALHLSNGRTLNDKLRDKTSVVAKWADAKRTDAEVIDGLFALALGRPPSATERAAFAGILADAAAGGPAARREAIEDFAWAVLTGREFLFNH